MGLLAGSPMADDLKASTGWMKLLRRRHGRSTIHIALVGAPGSGKSRMATAVATRLRESGLRVHVVKEAATALFEACGGFRGFRGGPDAAPDADTARLFQETILRATVADEDAAFVMARVQPADATVIISDAGAAAGQAYLCLPFTGEHNRPPAELPPDMRAPDWDRICAAANSSGADILRRYDAIIDLDTTALHPDEVVAAIYAFGPSAGNPHRYHDQRKARQLASAITRVHAGHRQYVRVRCHRDFSSKIDEAEHAVRAFLVGGKLRKARQCRLKAARPTR